MPVVMVTPKQGSGMDFPDRFKVTKAKHKIRVFPFQHGGESNLAAVRLLHFIDNSVVPCIGPGCPVCEEARRSKNKRLRAVTRYAMVVIDTESEEPSPLAYDAPVTVYKQIYEILNEAKAEGEDPDALLGNDGQDFIINHNAKASPAQQYSVTLRIKGSQELEIDESDIPDLQEMAEQDTGPVTQNVEFEEVQAPPPTPPKKGGKKAELVIEDEDEPDEVEYPEGANIMFVNAKDEQMFGSWDGAAKKDKLIVEVDGRLEYVKKNQVVQSEMPLF